MYGGDPMPFELWELRELAAGQWDMTARLTWTIHSLLIQPGSEADHNKYRRQSVNMPASEDSEETYGEKISALKHHLPTWIPPE